ncbi:MAG: restriction endonuclease subunit S, partial [Wenzhouxiangella sp.]|nr:restriction endonuclease subunit S [Wenzhouxiangella sp.]
MSKQKASTRNHPITPDPVIPAKAGISDDNTTLSSQRLLQLYDRVADAPDAVERLRKFVLDLAVRGKLVEQNDGDEPAKELLTRIKNEKEKLFKAGAIRKPKELPPIEEVPFEVPSNWEWARMREVTSDRGQKVPDRTFTYIDVSAINKEAGGVAEPRVLKKDEAPSRARKITAIDDVIYSCVRPYLLNVAVIDQEFEPEPIVSTAFAVLNGHGLVLPWYLWITLRSPFMIEQVEKNQRGQAYPAINDKDFSLLPFPLSPLAKQHRIVAKVDELMALLGRLETTRTKRET